MRPNSTLWVFKSSRMFHLGVGWSGSFGDQTCGVRGHINVGAYAKSKSPFVMATWSTSSLLRQKSHLERQNGPTHPRRANFSIKSPVLFISSPIAGLQRPWTRDSLFFVSVECFLSLTPEFKQTNGFQTSVRKYRRERRIAKDYTTFLHTAK